MADSNPSSSDAAAAPEVVDTTTDSPSTSAEAASSSSAGGGEAAAAAAGEGEGAAASVSAPAGLSFSKLGFGCWQLGSKGTDDYWQLEYTQEMANEMVGLAASNGFTYFDTAGDYSGGDSERQLGEALKTLDPSLRAKCIVGTKIVPNNCDRVEHHLTEQLARLQLDCVDLFVRSCVFVCGAHIIG